MRSKKVLAESDFFTLSQRIKNVILKTLSGIGANVLDLTEDDLKAEHHADKKIFEALRDFFDSLHIEANVFIESHAPILYSENPKTSIFIDPIDGSLNRDLAVGDPAIAIAYTLKQGHCLCL